jgi:hypothetical protein
MTPMTNTSAAHLVFNTMVADKIMPIESVIDVLSHINSRRTVPYDALLETFKRFGGSMLLEVIHYAAKLNIVRSYVVGPTMIIEWIGD